MARNISDIKEEVAREFMKNEGAAERYGFAVGANFGDHFGAASVENILLYVWAVCAWTVEQLVGLHRAEVTAQLEELMPHRPKWYRDKVLEFMDDRPLMGDTDKYDLSGMSESEIGAARVVKHAVATESKDASLLTIKVAGENGGKRVPLSGAQEQRLKSYIGEIKDAGVRVAVVNMEADTFGCTVDVYYNALLEPERVRAACEDAISGYIENLPFNGEYTNMALVDALKAVEGVKIAELKESTAQAANEATATKINARQIPAAGYFQTNKGLTKINMLPYDGEQDL